MTLPVWSESKSCARRAHCRTCLTDPAWRNRMGVRYAMPAGLTCPHGVTADNMVQRVAHGIAGLAKAAMRIERASDATIAARETTCDGCEHLDRSLLGIRRCSHCKCALAAKIRIKSERCPIGKWVADIE